LYILFLNAFFVLFSHIGSYGQPSKRLDRIMGQPLFAETFDGAVSTAATSYNDAATGFANPSLQ
jgi:hypothetical protein